MIGIVSCLKVGVSFVGFLSTFYTVIQLMLFLSYPSYEKQFENENLWSWSLLKNMLLLSLFILQHSLLALPAVKEFFTKYKLKDLQRSIYVITTCLVLQILFQNWERTPTILLWNFNNTTFSIASFLTHIFAWLMFYIGCICMDITEMLGVRQVYYSIQNIEDPLLHKSPRLKELYLHMRHPSFVGFLLIFWAVPIMSLDRFLLSTIFSLYMYVGWTVDDRDCNYVTVQHRRKFATLRN